MSFDPSNTTPDTSSPPQHRLHNPEEPLSSLERGRDTDCSPHISYASSEGRFLSGQPSATEANGHPASDGPASEQRGRGVVPGIGSTPPAQDTDPGAAIPGRTAFNTERPLGVTPVPEGGVAIGGQSELPVGHAGLGDKIVGKTEKVVGKYTNNPERHEKGELRETGGKAAAEGRARAAHD